MLGKVEDKEMMKVKANFVVFLVPLLLLMASMAKGQTIMDISQMGAAAHSDISKLMLDVWEKACVSPTPVKIMIPKKIYILTESRLVGPCKSPIEFNLEGVLQAPAKPAGEAMIIFRYIDKLTISGTGAVDGNGETGWEKNDCDENKKCVQLPMNMKFSFITNSIVKGITSRNSKNFQINIHGCQNFTIQHVRVKAPDHSPNTDGIHIGSSDDVHVLDTTIATGDDCISIGDKITRLYITNVTCGPGHGISLGSLGRNTKEKEVKGIFVKKCKFIGTDNGARIKTWPNSPIVTQASDIHFEDIEMVNVKYPIVIDQEYCPHDQCNKKIPSKVQISNVSFKNIRGTSSDPIAIKLICSKTYPCKGITFADINLAHNASATAVSECLNVVNPVATGKQIPKICAERAPSLLSPA